MGANISIEGFDLFSPSTWVPVFGNWGGPGWSGGVRTDGEPDWSVLPVLIVLPDGTSYESPVDAACYKHDRAYYEAKGLPDEATRILQADLQLRRDLGALDWDGLSASEQAYASLADVAFSLKIAVVDTVSVLVEQIQAESKSLDQQRIQLGIDPTGKTFTDTQGNSITCGQDANGNYVLNCSEVLENGTTLRTSFDSTGHVLPLNGAQTLANAINQYGSTLIDALSIIKAIQSGDPLPIAVSGLRLANDISNLADLPNYNLSGAASVGSSILSVLSLEQALQRGDTLAAVTAGAQAISFGAQAYANFATGLDGGKALQAAFGADSAISQLNEALPYLNLVNSIAHGDAIGAAVAVTDMVLAEMYAAYTVPYIGWAYAAYSIISSLFGDEDPPPEPWGSASAGWAGFGVVANAAGEHGGYEAAQGTMNQFIAQLNSLASYEQSVNPGSAIGIVANRLPSITYRNYTGFQLTDIDPITGVQRYPEIKYDLTGRPYNAPAGSEQASQSLSERFIRVALARDAIAPMWEVQTAAIQTQYGDPQAGLTEEERAGRNGLLAPPPQPSPAGGGGSQVFRAVALDLNGDGVQTTGAARTVAFDVDDSGFMKNTAWLNPSTSSGQAADGFLFLDRNLNGSIDSGKELFSNSIVDLSARGLAGMRWIDSNYDGRLAANNTFYARAA